MLEFANIHERRATENRLLGSSQWAVPPLSDGNRIDDVPLRNRSPRRREENVLSFLIGRQDRPNWFCR